MESPGGSSNQCEDTPLSTDKEQAKRLRNRLSQQAFRRRQAERIRELTNRVDADQKPDNKLVEALQKENRQLRAQLLAVQTQMSRLIITMQGLNDSVLKTLDDTAATQDITTTRDSCAGVSIGPEPPGYQDNLDNSGPSAPTEMTQFEPSMVDLDPSITQHPAVFAGHGMFSSELINTAGITPLYTQIPNVWSFQYQMGMQPYWSALTASEESGTILGKDWAATNSPFSDHIQLLQRLLATKLDMMGFVPDSQLSIKSLYQPVLMVLSMFNSITRPDVMSWYAKTRFYHIVELTAWQLRPSAATFGKLHSRYRPTETQMNHRHPRVIDWIPFPSIRDGLIRFHAANPRIDQIFCDAVTGYVVETSMSDLIRGAPPIGVYIRVTDLIATMSSTTHQGQEASVGALPAPDVTTLFTSPAHAHAAFKQLNMDKGASFYKIDPNFYAKYPELYDPSSTDLTASGIPLRPDSQKVLTYPKPLDSSTVETYRSFIDFCLDSTPAVS